MFNYVYCFGGDRLLRKTLIMCLLYSLKTCPVKLILWFYRVPCNYKMELGKTLRKELSRHYYYKGVQGVKEVQEIWNSFKGKIDNQEFIQRELSFV